MKSRILASILLSVSMLSATMQAQPSERKIKSNIPFDFVVGNESFPAGRYSIVLVGPVLLQLQDSEGHVLANVLTHSVESLSKTSDPKLRFDTVNGEHVLTQVWQADDFIGQQVLQPKSSTLVVRKHSGHVQTAEAGDPR
jgi:hypothetical protein